jgi:hypothetical protein
MVQGTPGRHPNIVFEATTEEEPPPVQRTLNTSTQGTGAGEVKLEPPGATYDEGTIVTVTAIPQAGSEFAGWSGDLSGPANPRTIAMDGDKQVVATFNLEQPPPPGQYTLGISLSGSGSGQITASPPDGPYESGTVVTLAAEAQPGSVFVRWSGDLAGSANPATITMDSNKQVTAVFDTEEPPPVPDIEEIKRLIRLAQQHLDEALRLLEQR